MTTAVFQSVYIPREVEEDRVRIVDYLYRYLRTKVNEPPRLNNGVQIKTKDREPIGQAQWKWSEVSGKYIGCPFWSVAAVEVFVRFAHGRPMTPALAMKAASGKCGPDQLQHEHVFPRAEWISMMRRYVGNAADISVVQLREMMNWLCNACIVTRAEHALLDDFPGSMENPWLRYRQANIKLLSNPQWTDFHRQAIEEAGLLRATM